MPWILSFPELVDLGHKRVAEHRFDAAADAYIRAAQTAPTEAYETEMLEFAGTCLRLELEKESFRS